MAKLKSIEKSGTDKPNKCGSKKSSPIKTKKSSRTKVSNKISSRSKISKISKPAKGTSELNWLKGLISENSALKLKTLDCGIKTHYSSAITLRKENNVEYSMFPWTKRRRSGYIKMHSLGVKEKSKTNTKMVNAFHSVLKISNFLLFKIQLITFIFGFFSSILLF